MEEVEVKPMEETMETEEDRLEDKTDDVVNGVVSTEDKPLTKTQQKKLKAKLR